MAEPVVEYINGMPRVLTGAALAEFNTRRAVAQAEADAKFSAEQAELQIKQVADGLSAVFDKQPAALKAAFASQAAGLERSLNKGEVETAREIIKQAEIAPELEPLRQELLQALPE